MVILSHGVDHGRYHQKFKSLPPDLQKEVEKYIDLLAELNKPIRKQKKFNLSWAGGLKEYRDQFTALELQKKALEWWSD